MTKPEPAIIPLTPKQRSKQLAERMALEAALEVTERRLLEERQAQYRERAKKAVTTRGRKKKT